MTYRFSIIMPIYNRASCLRRGVQSVINQSFDNWELILINDGSTDNTASICDEYVQADRRVKYIYQKNGGVCAARNSGLQASSGEYILFLDSDDFFLEETLKRLNDEIEANHLPDLIAFGNKSENGGGTSPSEALFGKVIGENEIKKCIIPAFINLMPLTDCNIMPMVTNKCYHHSLLKKHQISFDENFHTWEDGLFNAFVLKHTHSLVVIPDQLYIISDGGYGSDDHLSSMFFPNMVQNWVRQFDLVESIFRNEYDFSCEYGVRAYWNILDDLLKRNVKSNAPGEVFSFVASSEVVHRWVKVLRPKRKKETVIFGLIKLKSARLLRFVYRHF